MSIKERRKALGWNRAELARRAEVDRSMLQLIELGQSNDDESEQRCLLVLARAEAGDRDVQLHLTHQKSGPVVVDRDSDSKS